MCQLVFTNGACASTTRVPCMRLPFLAFLLAAIGWNAGAVSEAPRAELVGTLWWVTPSDAEQPVAFWQEELDHIEGLGMDLIVLNGPLVDAPFLDMLLPETDRRGMRVYLDTLQAPEWWVMDDPEEEIERAKTRIDRLFERYGHHASFTGWYIPYELYVSWDEQAAHIARLYGEISAHCKRISPARPVMISPFFILDRSGVLGTFRWAEPDEYRDFWTDLLRQARHIDIVALQDSGEHLSFYTIEERRPFFEAMRAACEATGTTLWANVESGELHVRDLDDYAERYGAGTHVNDRRTAPDWRGVPAETLIEKLRLAREFTPTAITWGYREYIRPRLGPDAAALHEAYRKRLNTTTP